MNWLTDVLKKVGSVIDAAVPVAMGARTKIAVVACPVIGYLSSALPTIAAPLAAIPNMAPVIAGVAAVLPYLQTFLCGAAGAFAYAGLVRNLK